MDYGAGLDVSMNETHICVVKRDGGVVREAKASSTPEAIAAVLETAPACAKIVLETGRNDARGLAHLPCTGFFKPVHVNAGPCGPRPDQRPQGRSGSGCGDRP